jgi:hypothetical protein
MQHDELSQEIPGSRSPWPVTNVTLKKQEVFDATSDLQLQTRKAWA